MTTKTETDYLAFVSIMGGGSLARGESLVDTVQRCLNITICDWGSMFKLDDAEMKINVFDVTGFDQVAWGADGIHGWNEDEGIPKTDISDRALPQVTFKTPPLGRYKSMSSPRYKVKLYEALMEAM